RDLRSPTDRRGGRRADRQASGQPHPSGRHRGKGRELGQTPSGLRYPEAARRHLRGHRMHGHARHDQGVRAPARTERAGAALPLDTRSSAQAGAFGSEGAARGGGGGERLMASMNKVFLIGNLTRPPELRYTPSGMAVTDLRLAVNNNYTTRSGEKREETCFLTVVVWGKQAESCNEYLDK